MALLSPPIGHTAHTYTHRQFSRASGNHLNVPFPFLRFLLWPPEPQVPATGSPWWRGFENHRPKTDPMYRSSPFPVIFRAFCTPNIPHTYMHPLSLSLLLLRLPRTVGSTLVLRLFDFPFPNSWCNRTPYSASHFPGFTLFRFLDKLGLR